MTLLLAPKIYGLACSGIRKWENYWGKRPIRYTQDRLECEKVSNSIVWMLTKDPTLRKDMSEKESSEAAK